MILVNSCIAMWYSRPHTRGREFNHDADCHWEALVEWAKRQLKEGDNT